MKKLNLLFTLAFILFASNTKATSPNLVLEWQKDIFPTEINFSKFSVDGKYIYCAIGNTIQKMDASNGEFVSIFEDKDKYWIYEMQISEQGNIIATRDGGGDINLWDTKLEKSFKHIPFGTGEGSSGAFCFDITPDGNFLIVGNLTEIEEPQQQYFNLLLYDIQKNEIIKSVPFDNSLVKIKFSHNGKYFVTGAIYSKDDNYPEEWYDQLILWETDSCKQIAILRDTLTKNGETPGGYKFLKFSYNDKYLGAVNINPWETYIYDLSKLELEKKSDGRTCANIEFLPDTTNYIFSYIPSEFYEIGTNNYVGKADFFMSKIESSFITKKVLIQSGDVLYLMSQNISSIKEINNNKGKISINTINNQIIVINSDSFKKQIQIIITDISGKTIYTKELSNVQVNEKLNLNLELPTGLYLCKIIEENNVYSEKIEIVR